LQLSVSAKAGGTTYTYRAVFHRATLAQAALRDPGLALAKPKAPTSNSTAGSMRVEGCCGWTSARTYRRENEFWLKKGESRSVVFTVWEDWSKGKWMAGMSARSAGYYAGDGCVIWDEPLRFGWLKLTSFNEFKY